MGALFGEGEVKACLKSGTSATDISSSSPKADTRSWWPLEEGTTKEARGERRAGALLMVEEFSLLFCGSFLSVASFSFAFFRSSFFFSFCSLFFRSFFLVFFSFIFFLPLFIFRLDFLPYHSPKCCLSLHFVGKSFATRIWRVGRLGLFEEKGNKYLIGFYI